MAQAVGEDAEAKQLHQASLAIFKDIGDQRHTAVALSFLNTLADAEGDVPIAERLLQESLEISRAINDQWGTRSPPTILARWRIWLESMQRQNDCSSQA